MEELLIKRVEADIRGLRMGTKTPEQIKIMYFLDKLKKLNDGLYDDYLEKYMKVRKMYDKK
tara:strand:+ start:247 stop:429 length:183 start_codon:yes stop_codon:yes gene_type:complete